MSVRRGRDRSPGSGYSSYSPLLLVIVGVVVVFLVMGRFRRHGETPAEAALAGRTGCSQVESAFRRHQSRTWVTVAAPVFRLLADSKGSSTHQRFIVRCSGGQTVLIDNNVDVGQRVPLTTREAVAVRGQYIWNRLGGLVHDTHHSTSATLPNGWIYAGGRVYQ